jgi:hypothetical protein
VAQVVQHLPSKCEALSSNPSTTKKKKKKNEKNQKGHGGPWCNPGYVGGRSRKTIIQGWPGQKCDTLYEK